MTGYTSQADYWRNNYDPIDSTPYCNVYRGPDGQIYIDWTPTDAPSWASRGQWSDDFSALTGHMPQSWSDAIQHIANTYGPESSTVHHIGYSRGGAFAEMFGGTGYGAMTNPAMPVAPGAHDEAPNEPTHWWDPLDMVHNLLHASHGHFDPFTPNPSQAGIPDQTPTTPVGPMIPPANVIEMFGHDDNGHSLIAAHPAMPFGASSYAGSLSGRSRFRSSYPANQTRRKTEQFGDLNAYNRVYQFYNYHGEKKQMLEEYCRSLVLSMVRIQKGVVHDYEEPIAWPFPIHQPEVTGIPHQDQHLDQYLNWIEFHFKDARRDGGFYGKTLGNRNDTEGEASIIQGGTALQTLPPLAKQYQYDIGINKPTCVQLWELVDPHDPTKGRRMKSLTKLAADITEIFESLAYLDTNFDRAHNAADPALGTPHVDSLDIRPCRIMLIKSLKVKLSNEQTKITHDVIYDDEQFASSRVDIGSYTTVTIHNVSPATGDIAMQGDPMAADTITHVPLIGKMYTFSGSCPKVWDKHKADLHQLFNPLFFRTGRYRLPHSKIHELDQFKSPPRGRAIWSNCIGESRIAIGPGQIKKLRMNFRIRDSLGEFWQKYRDHYLSDSRLGRTVCLCLEPMIRRQHLGEPTSIALKKTFDAADLAKYDENTNVWSHEDLAPINDVVEYQPYELKETEVNGVVSMRKELRPAFRLTSVPPGTPNFGSLASGAIFSSPPDTESGAIQYYFYSVHDTDKRICVGRAVHPTTLGDSLLALPDTNADNTLKNPDGSDVVAADWRLAKWTDDPARTSKGDPMMFNIQINRLLHAKTRLKKFHALGADKTGIKRKWEDRLKSVLGADLFGTPIHSDDPNYHGSRLDAPRDIDMFHSAGIRQVIAEGEAGNISVAAAPAVNVTVEGPGGLSTEDTTAAMVAALKQTIAHADGHEHAGKLKLGHHPLAGVVTSDNKLAVDHSSHPLEDVIIRNEGSPRLRINPGGMQLAMEQALYNPAWQVTGTEQGLKVQVTNTLGVSGNVGVTGDVPIRVNADGKPVDAAGNPVAVPVSDTNLPTVAVANSDDIKVKVHNPDDVKVKVHNPDDIKVKAHNPDDIKVIVHNPDDVKVQVSDTDLPTVPVANTDDVKVKVHNPDDVKVKVHNPDNVTVGVTPGETVSLAAGGRVDVNIDAIGTVKTRIDETTGHTQYRHGGHSWYNTPAGNVQAHIASVEGVVPVYQVNAPSGSTGNTSIIDMVSPF